MSYCVDGMLLRVRTLSGVPSTQYGKYKPCFNPDSLIICVQNSILTIVIWQSNLTFLVW